MDTLSSTLDVAGDHSLNKLLKSTGSGFPFRRRGLTVLLITIFPFYIQKLFSWFRFFRDLQLQIVEIIVADISTFEMDVSYDRIHCIGMFEDVNEDDWRLLGISSSDVQCLLQICYFISSAELAKSTTLFVVAMDHLIRQDTLKSRGEEWLKRMDQYLASIKPIKESTYGKDHAVKWTVYRRTFFIAVAELFA
ncbi:hypothetical protein H0E87_011995 [Populus deltoides]|uniref:Uncharacterized protein n=1 Tax=Populus deltoides TaxID=3696 RepID=A0A8T2YHR8_POPDE|nr:hypothetical protein H0E87_011995 [Populus deltoides]